MPYRYWVTDENAPEGEEAKLEEKRLVVPRSAVIEGNWRRQRPMGSGKAKNPWFEHLSKYRKSHPNLSLKEAMIKAKKTYKK